MSNLWPIAQSQSNHEPPIRLGVVGAGDMGRLYAELAAGLEGVDLVGICARPGAADSGYARSIGTIWFRDHGTLLVDARPEIVIVASPSQAHCEIVLDALASGSHVLCEKPLAQTVGDCDAMIGAAEAGGRRLGVIYPFRTNRLFRLIDEGLSGTLGAPVMAQMTRLERPALWGWYRDSGSMTSMFHEVVIHEIDALTRWLGKPRAVSAAWASDGRDDVNYPTSITATITYADDRIGVLTASWSSAVELGVGALVGSQGACSFDWRHGTCVSAVVDGKPQHHRVRGPWQEPYRQQVIQFARWVRLGEPGNVASGVEGRLGVVIAEAAVRSIAAGHPVEIAG